MTICLLFGFLFLATLFFSHDTVKCFQWIIDDAWSNIGYPWVGSRSHRWHVTWSHVWWMRCIASPWRIHHSGPLSVVHSSAMMIVWALRRIARLHSVASGVRMWRSMRWHRIRSGRSLMRGLIHIA